MISTQTTDVTSELELVITASQMEALREWTLQEDGIERFAYLFCEENNGRLLTREVDPVPADECAVQEAHAVRPSLDVERERLGSAMEEGLVPVMVHSHPFSDHPGFSSLDDNIMESYRNWIGQLYPETPLGFAVVGHRGLETAVYVDPADETRTRLGIDIVGEWMLDTHLRIPDRESKAVIDTDRYDRAIRALTEDGQRAITETTVAVVGLGGLGSMTAVQLARFGVEDFLFVDPDVVERSNLPRIYGATDADIGRHKVDVVGEHVVQANPNSKVQAYRGRVQEVPEDALVACDVIIGTVDRLTARLYCNEFAVRHLRYYIDGGVAIETDDDGHVTDERGLVQLVVPGVNACMDCLGRNDAEHLHVEQLSDDELEADIERGYIDEEVRSPEPAITPLNGMAASSITRLFTKLVTGYTAPADYLRIDGLNDELLGIGTHPTEQCVTCGDGGMLGMGTPSFDESELVAPPTDEFDIDGLRDHLRANDELTSRLITSDRLAQQPDGDLSSLPENLTPMTWAEGESAHVDVPSRAEDAETNADSDRSQDIDPEEHPAKGDPEQELVSDTGSSPTDDAGGAVFSRDESTETVGGLPEASQEGETGPEKTHRLLANKKAVGAVAFVALLGWWLFGRNR
ncbi:HesA/MoeB/ThiF family protein [Haloferax marisrubri]|uniref:THIF-type NAD/FAD binding fold domain-containing protein n=1 Tax=Haloferax marisrubri TaxID=1544719 RepID=A0A2P4NPL7_9EURY|nr:ThiF family adenylyltransferase [Haloferax marisrubri]POG55090.1 hypothetical protein AUR65_011725 [Haloferax marisrubri]